MTTEVKGLLFCGVLAAGEALGFAAGGYAALWPVAAGATAVLALAGFGASVRGWPVAGMFALGFTLALATADRRQRTLDGILEARATDPAVAEFVVGGDMTVTPLESGGRRCAFNGEIGDVPVRVLIVRKPGERVPAPGERWRCSGWLGRTGDGPFGRRRPFRVRGRRSAAECLPPDPAAARMQAVRDDLSRRLGIGEGLREENADLSRAMLLGERHRLAWDRRSTLIAAGSIPLFAISGLHVLLIARLLAFVLQVLRVPVRTTGCVLIPMLWGYVVLVGAGPSAVRAALMASVYYGAYLFWRRPNGFTAWAAAFFITYVRDPASLFDVGCGLSFVVMLALVFWSWWCRPFGLSRPLAYLTFSAVAWLAGVPIAAHVFGRVTWGGLVTNAAGLPFAVCGVFGGVLGIATSYVSETVAGYCNHFSALSTMILEGLSQVAAAVPGATAEIVPWRMTTCVICYAAGAALLVAVRHCLLVRRERL